MNATLGASFGCQVPAAKDCGPCRCDPASGCNCNCNQPSGCSALGVGCFLNTCCVGNIGATCNSNWPGGQGGCCGDLQCGTGAGGGVGKCCLPYQQFGCTHSSDCCDGFTCAQNGQCT
jgi:hypothetical protein